MKQLLTALAKFKQEVGGVKKNGFNPLFKSKFADLGDYIEATEATLLVNGLMITQTFDLGPVMVTTLWHISGEKIESRCPFPYSDNPQANGACITYFRRYTWSAILGMVALDEDAQSVPESKQSTDKPQWRTDIPIEKAPACPECKCLYTGVSRFAGQKYYCNKSKGGCGHKWGGLNNIASEPRKSGDASPMEDGDKPPLEDY